MLHCNKSVHFCMDIDIYTKFMLKIHTYEKSVGEGDEEKSRKRGKTLLVFLCVDYKQSIYKRGKTSGLFCMDRYFKTTHFLYS